MVAEAENERVTTSQREVDVTEKVDVFTPTYQRGVTPGRQRIHAEIVLPRTLGQTFNQPMQRASVWSRVEAVVLLTSRTNCRKKSTLSLNGVIISNLLHLQVGRKQKARVAVCAYNIRKPTRCCRVDIGAFASIVLT